ALRAMDAGLRAGLAVSSNMQINRLNHQMIRQTCSEVRAHGAQAWQVQLTVPMGHAADRPEGIIEPCNVVGVIDTLAAIQREAVAEFEAGVPSPGGVPFNVFVGNNVGY